MTQAQAVLPLAPDRLQPEAPRNLGGRREVYLADGGAEVSSLAPVKHLVTELRAEAPNVFVTYPNSAALVQHNQHKIDPAFGGDGPETPQKPEYSRYGNEKLSMCEVAIARELDVGSAALFPTPHSALVSSVLTYVDTRMLGAQDQRTLVVDRRLLDDPYLHRFFIEQLPKFGIRVAAVELSQMKGVAQDSFLVVVNADDRSDLDSIRAIGQIRSAAESGVIVHLSGSSAIETPAEIAKFGGIDVVTAELHGSIAHVGLAIGGDSASRSSPNIRQIRERRGLFGALPGLLEQATAIIPNVELNGDTQTFRKRVDALGELSPLKPRLISDCEAQLARLERCESAVLFGSGMAAVTTTLAALLNAGDHVIMSPNSYRNTLRFGRESLRARGVKVSEVSFSDEVGPDGAVVSAEQQLRKSITEKTKVLYIESPTIPYLRVTDFEMLARVARDCKLKVVIDATLASPFNQDLAKTFDGVEFVVVHSATKYLTGNNKVLAGVAMGQSATIDLIRANSFAPVGTFEAADILDRLGSAPSRVAQQNQISIEVARALETDPELSALVVKVWYPGLESHPDHRVATKQMTGFGGLVYFALRKPLGQEAPSVEDSRLFLDASGLPNAASFGGDFTMLQVPVDISYAEVERPIRLRRFGVDDNVLRLAVGCDDSAASVIEKLRAGARALKKRRAPHS